MLDKFWETIGEDLARRWLDHLFGPAFLFWAGGLGLHILESSWDETVSIWTSWDIFQQAAALLIALLMLFLSSLAMKKVQFPALRFLEGYWPWPLSHLGSFFISRNRNQLAEKSKELHELKAKEKTGMIALNEQDRLIRLEAWLHSNPPAKNDLLPTRLGNLLRARELASSRKYGLDSTVCLPRLWCLLHECLQERLTSSRAALNQSAEVWLWGLLFFVWTGKSYLAIPVSFLWMLVAYYSTLQTAAVYGDLVETAFDIHRFALYDAMNWERPRDSEEETVRGAQLTEFLWRGTTKEMISFMNKMDSIKKG